MVLDCIICYMLYVKSDYSVFHSSLYEAFCLNARHGRAPCFVRVYPLRSLHHSPGSLYLLYIPSSLFMLPVSQSTIHHQYPHSATRFVTSLLSARFIFVKKLESFFSPWAGNVSHSIMPRRFFRKIIHYLPLFYQSPLFTPVIARSINCVVPPPTCEPASR